MDPCYKANYQLTVESCGEGVKMGEQERRGGGKKRQEETSKLGEQVLLEELAVRIKYNTNTQQMMTTFINYWPLLVFLFSNKMKITIDFLVLLVLLLLLSLFHSIIKQTN